MSEIFDSLFDSLKVQLAADDMAVRMKALHASRSLTLSERFSLVAIAQPMPMRVFVTMLLVNSARLARLI